MKTERNRAPSFLLVALAWLFCLCLAVTASPMVNTVNATAVVYSGAGEPLAKLEQQVKDLPDSAFKDRNLRESLLNNIEAVCKQVATGAYQGAISKMENEVKDKIMKGIAAPEQGALLESAGRAIEFIAKAEKPLQATIRTTSHGIPHVVSDDDAGVGFGAGYAFARDCICDIAGRYVTVNAQRSRFFGPDATVDFGPNLATTNLQNDFVWQWILDQNLVEKELRLPAPLGPTAEVRELIRGYVAGYNKYLEETGVANLPDLRCAGADWVRPITEKDIYLRAMHWNLWRSSGALAPQLVNATPPGTASMLPNQETLQSAFNQVNQDPSGSNMIALGSETTDNERGMLLANPHWYWYGPERWYEIHLTIPGKLNVYGIQTLGIPVVQTGFTDNVAWAGTSSFANRYTPYELKLVPGFPTSYVYDGSVRKMTSRTVKVEVKLPNGQLETREHTFWETHFGPMLKDSSFVWTASTAYAIRDVGYGFRWLGQQYALNHAQSVKDISEGGKKYMAIGWRNLSAADMTGKVFYGDRTAVPYVTNDMVKECVTSALGQQLFDSRRLVVLDGSRSKCEWGTDPDAPVPGIFSARWLPELLRNDYVEQSNDTHWANNARQLLEGYPWIMGAERTARTLRTRNGLFKIERRLAGADGYGGNKFTLDLLEKITMNNFNYTVEIWRDAVVKFCQSMPPADGVSEACPMLAAWDGKDDLDSPGAVLWRRFVERLDNPSTLFTMPFNPADPMNTPAGLNTSDPKVSQALKQAVADLSNSSMPLNATLRNYQYKLAYNGEKISIHGGIEGTGQFNLINTKGWVAGVGYPDVSLGSSFIMFTQFTPTGPMGYSVMTYSQSPNPNSPYYKDQTLMFQKKEYKMMLFKEGDILGDPNLKVTEIRSNKK